MNPTAQTSASISRWGPAAGLASAALLLYALLGPPRPPAGDAPAAAWQAHLAAPGNRLLVLGGTLAAAIAGVLFVAFVAGLRQRGLLARGRGPGSEPDPSRTLTPPEQRRATLLAHARAIACGRPGWSRRWEGTCRRGGCWLAWGPWPEP